MAFDDELPMTREIVQQVDLGGLPVDRVEVRRITMAPGLAPGAHVHDGPVMGVVVEGAVRFQVAGGAERVLRPGEVFHEPADTVIAHFDALDEGAVFLGWFPLTAGQEAGISPAS